MSFDDDDDDDYDDNDDDDNDDDETALHMRLQWIREWRSVADDPEDTEVYAKSEHSGQEHKTLYM